MPRLGDRIRELREERHLKQAALARAIPVAPQTLSNWETGVNRVPADSAPAIAKALGVTVCELYGVEEGHALVRAEGGSGKTALYARLVRALEQNEGRVLIVFTGAGASLASAGRELSDSSAAIVLRDLVQDFPSLTPELQHELLALADDLKEHTVNFDKATDEPPPA